MLTTHRTRRSDDSEGHRSVHHFLVLRVVVAGADVGRAVRLAVEFAAIAHLTGASIAAQVGRYDDALAGLVLSEAERNRVASIRAVIAAGWRATWP